MELYAKYNLDKESCQEGIKYRYPCGECEYDAITPADLKTHMETIHAGIRLPPFLFEYSYIFPRLFITLSIPYFIHPCLFTSLTYLP